MYLLRIDDLDLTADVALAELPLITDLSERLSFAIEHREGRGGEVFFGGKPEGARWHVVIKPMTVAARDAIIAALTRDLMSERRLTARRIDAAQTVVTAAAAIERLQTPNDFDLIVEFAATDSIWQAVTPQTTTLALSSSPAAIPLSIPGNTSTQPRLTVWPQVQRTGGIDTVGWKYRRRVTVTNQTDTDWHRLPIQIPLGDTRPLVPSKALASGADLRVVIDGLERQRTLVTWNAAASVVWVICDALPAGASQTVDLWYGNAQAGAAPVLTYPNLPPFLLDTSTNLVWYYAVDPVPANAGKGLWFLSKPTAGALADFTVPGAWQRVATINYPSNEDDRAQPSEHPFPGSGTTWAVASLHAYRAPSGTVATEELLSVYDGVALTHPCGIVSVYAGFIWYNVNSVGEITIAYRDSAAQSWIGAFALTGAVANYTAVAAQTYTFPAPAKQLAIAAWPANASYIAADAVGAVYAELDGTFAVTLGSGGIGISSAAEEEIYEVAARFAIGGGSAQLPPYSAVLVGNANEASGEGTPRASLKLDEALILDTDARTHEVVVTATGERRGLLSTHSVRSVVGIDDGGIPREDPANDWLPLLPALPRTVSNGDFPSSIAGWTALAGDPTGTLWQQIATYGPTFNALALSTVTEIAADPSGSIWIADTGNGRAIKVSAAGAYQQQILGLVNLAGIAVDSTGAVYVSTFTAPTGYLVKYSAAGVQQWSQPNWIQTNRPMNLATDSTHLYVIHFNNAIGKYRCSDGVLVTSWGTPGSGTSQFNAPLGIAYSAPGTQLYVVDSGNTRVQVFTVAAGAYQRQFAVPAGSVGASVDSAGNVWVGVQSDDSVRRYGSTGTLLTQLALVDPGGVAVAAGDTLWAASQVVGGTLAVWDEFTAATARAWSTSVGGLAVGSYRFTVTSNAVGSAWWSQSDARYALANEAPVIRAWVRTDTAALVPLLGIAWYDAANTLLGTSRAPSWTPPVNSGVQYVYQALPPPRSTQYAIQLGVVATTFGATGNVYFDDLARDETVLIASGPAPGTIGLTLDIPARFLG